MFIKAIFKDSRQVKRIRNYVSVFLDIAKFVDFREKNADFTRIQRLCHVTDVCFGSSLGKM